MLKTGNDAFLVRFLATLFLLDPDSAIPLVILLGSCCVHRSLMMVACDDKQDNAFSNIATV